MESIIIFKDRSRKEITNNAHNNLLEASTKSQSFSLGGCLYQFNSVDKILYDYEFYEQYPAERPIEYKQPIALPALSLSEEQSKQRRIARLQSVISGVEWTNATELLKQLRKKLEALTNGGDIKLAVDKYP